MNRLSPAPVRTAAFAVHYLTSAERAAWRAPVLAEIHYGASASAPTDTHPRVDIAMRQLQPTPLIELWSSATPVQVGAHQGFSFAHNGEVLFGAYRRPIDAAFEVQTHAAYRELLALGAAHGYGHLLRIWNHFANITAPVGELDRYKIFCRARAQALETLSVAQLPAASAVGSHGDTLAIYFLAGKSPGVALENPRQISAYRYPPQYGPRSPTFARATWVAPSHLFISGTASIVGHASVHVGDTAAQVAETVDNITALLSASESSTGIALGHARLALIKVYLRDASAYAAVRAQLQKLLPPAVPALYLHADICRTDLLLEIEGIAMPAQ